MPTPVDRTATVARHAVHLDGLDPRSPLSVGNGEFAFTADITGLQSLPGSYPVGPRDRSLPPGTLLGTQAQWGWHSVPAGEDFRLEDSIVEYRTTRGPVGYVDMVGTIQGGTETGTPRRDLWLRANPHRLDLGRIGLLHGAARGHAPLELEQITDVHQVLDLARGLLHSRFRLDGAPVEVRTACDPEQDALAIEVSTGAPLALSLAFPYGNEAWHNAADWTQPEAHTTELEGTSDGWFMSRTLDATRYHVRVVLEPELRRTGPHSFVAELPQGTTRIVVAFGPGGDDTGPAPSGSDEIIRRAADHWCDFWAGGGAVDFSASEDPRAFEIERRTVLSQYLTAINCAGSSPAQETGLVCNSWRGRFHLEMHWWHSAHFAQWGRPDLLLRSLRWYHGALATARGIATRQGYAGARWPKQVGPDARESPSEIGPFLVWQQPHVIYMAELAYRARPNPELLTEFAEIVFATAEFMADFAVRADDGAYDLLAPLVPAQESYGRMRRDVRGPAYEQVYWHWALDVAQNWRARLGLPEEPTWRAVSAGMRPPVVRDGRYPAIAVEPWTIRKDHPSMLCALGLLPATDKVDPEVMRATLNDVLGDWNWETTWGWDYPVIAMTAARLGMSEVAVDALVSDRTKNIVLASGHNWQSSSLPLYLPGNGGLLSAVALLAAGSDTGPDDSGFPPGWHVRHEGLIPAP